jgi:hypothetical protein
VTNDILPPSSSISLYLNCSGIRAWDCYLNRLVDYANCTGTLNPDPGLSCGLLSVTTDFMYQNQAITYQDDRTDEFTRVTLIVSDSQIQCPAGCNEGDSWIFDIDLGPDLEYITSGTPHSYARWKVKEGWSIHFGPPASRTLTSRQNYLIRTESIGGIVNSTACNKTTDKPWTVDQRINVPYTAEYMMYSCIDDSLDDDDDSHSKAPFISASTVVIAMFVVIMMAQFL